jgi:hypothetical protein
VLERRNIYHAIDLKDGTAWHWLQRVTTESVGFLGESTGRHGEYIGARHKLLVVIIAGKQIIYMKWSFGLAISCAITCHLLFCQYVQKSSHECQQVNQQPVHQYSASSSRILTCPSM